jgi:hypothetical protein
MAAASAASKMGDTNKAFSRVGVTGLPDGGEDGVDTRCGDGVLKLGSA